MNKCFCDNCGEEIQGEPKKLRFFTEKDFCKKCHNVISKYCSQELDKIRDRIEQGFKMIGKGKNNGST